MAIELAFWDSISASKEPSDFREYLDRFPNGQFRSLASRRLASLDRPADIEIPDVQLQTDPTDTLPETPPLRLSREAVRNLQERLNILGYSAVAEDGIAGRRTRAAVAAFRQSEGLRGGGEFDANLMQRLAARVPDARLRSDRTGNASAATSPASLIPRRSQIDI